MRKRHFGRRSNQHVQPRFWLCLTLVATFFSILPAHAQTTLTIAHPVDATGILEEALPDLGERLSVESGGQVSLEPMIPPADDAQESVQLVYEGEAEFALIPIGEAVELSDKFAVFEVPFLFDNLGAVDRFMDTDEGRIVLDSLREYGLIGVGLLHEDLRDLKGPFVNADPASLVGILGVDERAHRGGGWLDVEERMESTIAPFNALGARSLSAPLADFEEPLSEGQISAEVTVPRLLANETLRSGGQLVVSDHRYQGWVLVANRNWLESLSDLGRGKLQGALSTWLSVMNARAEVLIRDGLDVVVQSLDGYVVLDFAQKERWRDALAESLPDYELLVGGDIIQAARRSNIVTQGRANTAPRSDPRPMDLQPVQRQVLRSHAPLPWEIPMEAGVGVAPEDESFTPVQLFFGTDRERTGPVDDPTFTGNRSGELELGSVVVTVPRTHELGQIERPSSYLFGLVTLSEDEDQHIVMRTPALLSREDFVADLRAIVNKSGGRKQAFVFVHGFNVTFPQAARRTAQIAYDLEFDGAATFYSWPSAGNIDQYVYDQDSARQARDTLQEFLELVRTESGAEIVHLIGHSMGTNPLMEAVARMWDRYRDDQQGPLFNQVVLAAADIDRDVFFDLAEQVNGAADAFTLYASKKDVALKASGLVHGGVPRIGHVPENSSPIVREPVDTIDATLLNTDFFALGHSDYAEHEELMTDIGKLFLDGTRPPDARTEKMTPMPGDGEQPYWVFQP